MISAWLKGQPEPDKLKNSILGSRTVLERLDAILVEELERLDRSETNVSSFDNPNWAHLQAFKNGKRSIIGDVRNLLNLDRKDNKNND